MDVKDAFLQEIYNPPPGFVVLVRKERSVDIRRLCISWNNHPVPGLTSSVEHWFDLGTGDVMKNTLKIHYRELYICWWRSTLPLAYPIAGVSRNRRQRETCHFTSFRKFTYGRPWCLGLWRKHGRIRGCKCKKQKTTYARSSYEAEIVLAHENWVTMVEDFITWIRF